MWLFCFITFKSMRSITHYVESRKKHNVFLFSSQTKMKELKVVILTNSSSLVIVFLLTWHECNVCLAQKLRRKVWTLWWHFCNSSEVSLFRPFLHSMPVFRNQNFEILLKLKRTPNDETNTALWVITWSSC